MPEDVCEVHGLVNLSACYLFKCAINRLNPFFLWYLFPEVFWDFFSHEWWQGKTWIKGTDQMSASSSVIHFGGDSMSFKHGPLIPAIVSHEFSGLDQST